jgi:hypothetical protein
VVVHRAYAARRLLRKPDRRRSLVRQAEALRDRYAVARGFTSWVACPGPVAALIEIAVEVRLFRRRLFAAFWARQEADPFGDAVRGRGDAGRQMLERLKRLQRERDPVGAAISERRPPLFSSHPTLDELGRRPEPDEAPPLNPSDPFGDAVTRPRPPRRRPVGVSLRVKR